MFKKFNTWYDKVREPNRFAYLVAYMVPTVLLCMSPIHELMIIGVVMLAVIAIVGVTRL